MSNKNTFEKNHFDVIKSEAAKLSQAANKVLGEFPSLEPMFCSPLTVRFSDKPDFPMITFKDDINGGGGIVSYSSTSNTRYTLGFALAIHSHKTIHRITSILLSENLKDLLNQACPVAMAKLASSNIFTGSQIDDALDSFVIDAKQEEDEDNYDSGFPYRINHLNFNNSEHIGKQADFQKVHLALQATHKLSALLSVVSDKNLAIKIGKICDSLSCAYSKDVNTGVRKEFQIMDLYGFQSNADRALTAITEQLQLLYADALELKDLVKKEGTS